MSVSIAQSLQSIQSKIFTLVVVSIAVLFFVSFAFVETFEKLETSIEEQNKDSKALKTQMDADMMHDAIRSDVLASLRAGAKQDQAQYEEAQASFNEHAERFKKDMEENSQINLPEEIIATIEKTRPLIDRYIESAGNIVNSAANNPEVAESMMPQFTEDFEVLEESMGELGNSLESLTSSQVEEVKDEMTADLSKFILMLAGIGGLFLIIAGGLVFLLFRPMRSFRQEMVAVSEDKLEMQINGLSRHDEVGQMAKALDIFRSGLLEKKKLDEIQRKEVAERQARTQKRDDLCKAFDSEATEVLAGFSSAVHEMEACSQSVATASTQLFESIKEISRSVTNATNMIDHATRDVKATEDAVKGLKEVAGQINNITTIISDIAEKTNLLALNATIEAARAGDAGKGFSVVANEVKSLAGQTAKATEDIQKLVDTVHIVADNATHATEKVVTKVEEIRQTATTISAAVQEQSAATQQISGSGEGNQDRGAMGEMLQALSQLTQQSSKLSDQVGTFLRALAA